MTRTCPPDLRAALGACSLSTPLFDLNGTRAWCRVVSVHDADTCHVVLDVGAGCYRRVVLRLEGVDGAEIRSTDGREKALAVQARDRLLNWLAPDLFPAGQGGWAEKEVKHVLASSTVTAFARLGKHDKYGRTLCRLFRCPDDSAGATDMLLRGAGVDAYDGGHKDKAFLDVSRPVNPPTPSVAR